MANLRQRLKSIGLEVTPTLKTDAAKNAFEEMRSAFSRLVIANGVDPPERRKIVAAVSRMAEALREDWPEF
jgi:hypothetical protein